MQNATMKVEGNKLTITVDLSKTVRASKSGKNVLVATSGGNESIPGKEGFKIGLNVYRPITEGEAKA